MASLFRLPLDIILALAAPRSFLVAENLLLPQQVIVLQRRLPRPRARRFDRWLILSGPSPADSSAE